MGPVKEEDVSHRPSTKGAYVSVRINVMVHTPEQVCAQDATACLLHARSSWW